MSTGAATQIGTIGNGSRKIVGVTAQPVPESSLALGSVLTGGIALLRRCRRRLKSLS
ncbi:MAG: PEP-CTERM sorting domain-containing protein [Microcoleus sp. SIO2G3]|nr:PEP-CTERM sorting domain-containing protein [Microcoleus sp. SIO2G3]